MIFLLRRTIHRRLFLIAIPLAISLALLLPGLASAHAILLRSDPAQDAKLSEAPQQVHMWFSEDLNPAFSTAVVLNAKNQHLDKGDAHVNSSDPREMDVTLQSNLPSAVYIVVWRTDSANDGHILRGSFLFTVTRPGDTVPTLNPGSTPGANVLGGGNLTGLYTGQIDGPTLFNLIVITLVELGAVFWVGAQLWLTFVLQLSSDAHTEQRAINEQVQQRFEQRISVPVLLVLLLANIGVLVGQALNLTGGQLDTALSLPLLVRMATSGRFGTFWNMREIVIALALLVGLYIIIFRKRSRIVDAILPWINLALGLALFIAITMSSHAAAVGSNIVVYAIMVDWLHLLAAALWVGGMMYISVNYLPVLTRRPVTEQAHSLITVLPYFSALAIAGVIIMAITGPFSATFHLTSWNQFLTTAYGRALLVKILLVGALILTSAIHVGRIRPRLKKEYKKYTYVVQRLQAQQEIQAPDQVSFIAQPGTTSEERLANRGWHPQNIELQSHTPASEPDLESKAIAHQVKLRTGRLAKGTRRLTQILRWEPVLGVAVLVCVGLMNVFAGTLSPIAAAAQQQQAGGTTPKPFIATVRTSDNKYTVTLNVNPNRFGTNVFTVSVVDTNTGSPTTNVGVSLYTTMLDMDMGTDTLNLQSDGKGHFSGSGDLAMAGDWQIRIQIRTPETTLHEAKVNLLTPF